MARFRLWWWRCSPLNAALCLISITNHHCFYIQQYEFGYHIEL
ncbi:superoxide dismutase [Vibrio anguillarum]|uniref:Superoxide dismutase n=1 Tax=Vibrio anguillarum TaxID=55601 RepID=A0AAW4BCP8_VIBAN|nr:superoxide dismutase [Vibrio anguillarum]